MGARGTKPTPTAILEARGSWRAKVRTGEPKVRAGSPSCPKHLSAQAKKIFKALIKLIEPMNVLTIADGEPLGCLAQAIYEAGEATKVLDSEGRFQKQESGRILAHPAIVAQRSAWATIGRLSAMFGLDPSSRSSLKMIGTESGDPMESFLSEKPN